MIVVDGRIQCFIALLLSDIALQKPAIHRLVVFSSSETQHAANHAASNCTNDNSDDES